MRAIIFRKVGSSVGRSSFTGGTLTGPLILASDPTQPLEAATKQYVDSSLAALGTGGPISGTIPVASLPAFTGDVTSSTGANTLTLSNTGVTAGTYAKVTVDAKGRVTAGGALADSDIPNLDWSKITDGKPTTLSDYGITDGVSKSGDTMTGPLTLSGNATNPLHAVPLQQVNKIASGNNGVEFIASGAIPRAGLTVGLNANGTVSVITASGQPGSWGEPTTFHNDSVGNISPVYDSANQKVVIVYTIIGQGYAIVGTVSGNSISFGEPVTFIDGTVYEISAVYDSYNQKVVIAYTCYNDDRGFYYYGVALVGTVSGNSISFNNEVIFSDKPAYYISAVYDSYNQKVVIAYRSEINLYSSHGRAIVGAISGTSISFGEPVFFSNSSVAHISATYDTISNKIVIAYSDNNNNQYGAAVVGTVSGNSISFGSPVFFNSSAVNNISTTYDPTNQKVVIAFYTASHKGTVILGTVSGTSVSFGKPILFDSRRLNNISTIYDSVNQNVIITYFHGNDNNGYVITRTLTISGNNMSLSNPVAFSTPPAFETTIHDPTNQKVVMIYTNLHNGTALARVYSPGTFATNKNTFIGISQNPATNNEIVNVKIKGQVDSNQSGLITGQLYYVSDNGTLTTTSTNNPLAGRAISDTKLLITNWAIS